MSATPKELTFKNWSWVRDSSEAHGRRKHKIALQGNFHKPPNTKSPFRQLAANNYKKKKKHKNIFTMSKSLQK